MSIWGPGPFENDDGADWFGDLREQPDLALIRDALEEVADPTHAGFIDVANGSEAIAAAAVLAELLGGATNEPELAEEDAATLRAEWEAESLLARQGLLRDALSALELVVNDEENSESRHLREDSAEGLAQWMEEMQDLQTRLAAIAGKTR